MESDARGGSNVHRRIRMTEGTRPPGRGNAVAACDGIRETTPHVMPARRRSPRACQKASAGRRAGMRIAIVRAGRRISDSGSPLIAARTPTHAFKFLSFPLSAQSDSRPSHFWTILFCTGRWTDAASAARRARRLPDGRSTEGRTSAARNRARGFPFSGNATQRIATWTVNR
ncbi:hypothetical protein [Burkholderia multivorans]|uniref:hypothetical protein n=2 Tax=Burkholderia multivorans TaxID=87883 RepID=UPI0021C11A15|nr:hypothetical protein [Burkholderia multivorans]MBU9551138.1 hypothetical protein [Burkholderia multivorans]